MMKLTDSQAKWTPMINTLRGDRVIRHNYQFWFYGYRSRDPYPNLRQAFPFSDNLAGIHTR
jgi:hypothetical protein